MIRYVAGLLFDDLGEIVALVRKDRPAWQAGMLNAIGGKIEPGESEAEAIAREFYEEAGVLINSWERVADLEGPDFVVHFYSARSTDALYAARTMESEVVGRYPVQAALNDRDLIPNLRVMIALALDDTGIKKPVTFYDARAAA